MQDDYIFKDQILQFSYEREIGVITYTENHKVRLYFSINDLKKLNDMLQIHIMQEGGLVLGRSHDDGGIFVLTETGIKGREYEYTIEMEGWEYVTNVMNAESTTKFNEINNKYSSIPTFINVGGFEIPDYCNVIDLSDREIPIIVFIDSPRYIINSASTKAFINEIIELDKKLNK